MMKTSLELYYRWNHEGLYKEYKDYDLGELIEFARRGLQVDLGFAILPL
jgi:hypothetical protein